MMAKKKKSALYQTPAPRPSKTLVPLDQSVEMARMDASYKQVTLPNLNSGSGQRSKPQLRRYDAR